MKKFIVTTTIYEPTKAMLKFCEMKDWTLIVVGDKKTPHNLYRDLDCIYLDPDYQDSQYPELSEAIGWNKIMRRNIGFVEAYNRGADIVATVDDDNIPYDNWGEEIYVGQEIEVDCYSSENGYFDPLSVTSRNDCWHRGYPLQHVPTKNNVSYEGKIKRKVLVQADLWDGDPDIDATCRLTKMPIVKYDEVTKPYCSEQVAPFNSQNTFLHRDVIPYYMVLPFVGRMDDIWGGYLLQKKFPNSVIYNKATVYQDRNLPDLITNLENEIIGYRNTIDFIAGDYQLPEDAQRAYDAYRECFVKCLEEV